MFTFLEKVSQLKHVCDVFLLTRSGEPLYVHKQEDEEHTDKKITILASLIKDLDYPGSTHIYYENGALLLADAHIGYIVIGLQNKAGLVKIQTACANVQTKLQSVSARKKILLKMFNDAEAKLRPNIIKALNPYADKEVASLLLPVLKSFDQLLTEGAFELLTAVLQVLGHTSSVPSLEQLKMLQANHQFKDSPQYRKIEEALKVAITQLELDVGNAASNAHSSESSKMENPASVSADLTAAKVPEKGPSSAEEQQLTALLQNNEKKAAMAFVLEEIKNLIKKNLYSEAEIWREKMMAIDPMAIQEIIKAAELIEEARAAAITEDYLQVWKQLSKILSRDEFTALYHAMEYHKFATGDTIVEQGKFYTNLYFINSGRVQVSTKSLGRSIPLKILEGGDIFGAEHFFEGSVWTVKAESLGAEISILSMTKLNLLKESYPALQGKLIEFCGNFQSLNSLFIKSSKNRRKFERKKLTGRVGVTLLDVVENDLGTSTKGDLVDISQGGVSFCLHFSRRKYALALLSKSIEVTIRPDKSLNSLQKTGKIMAVRCHDYVGNEYSLHVEFDEELTPMEWQKYFPR